MKNMMVLIVLCLSVVVVSCSGERQASPAKAVTPNAAEVAQFANTLRSVLPDGWKVTQSEYKTSPENEGIHLYAGNPDVVMDGPKGKYSPYIRLYFRPHSARAEGGEYLMDGSVLSMQMGKTEKYDVYGGSVGIDLTKQVQKAFSLSQESQNH